MVLYSELDARNGAVMADLFIVSNWNGLNDTLLYLETLVSDDEYERVYHMLHGANYQYRYLMRCEKCASWYLANHKDSRYCSKDCYGSRYRKREKARGTCPECGEEFTGRADKRYCVRLDNPSGGR
jgi:hypothetical protein